MFKDATKGSLDETRDRNSTVPKILSSISEAVKCPDHVPDTRGGIVPNESPIKFIDVASYTVHSATEMSISSGSDTQPHEAGRGLGKEIPAFNPHSSPLQYDDLRPYKTRD